MNLYEQVIHKTRYSKWREEEGKRESWPQTVSRYVTFLKDSLLEKQSYIMDDDTYNVIFNNILNRDVMPSMRLLLSAGEAARIHEASAYNCAYLEINSWKSFSNVMYLLTVGAGVGFSVEQRCVSKLPEIQPITECNRVIIVEDNKVGWCKAFHELLTLLSTGQCPIIDYSLVREEGAPLKTFGGKASGPAVLKDLFEHTKELFKKVSKRDNNKLTRLECHDLLCKISSIIICGGIRRSALISLFDLTDKEMLGCKNGAWDSDRVFANNSAVFEDKPTMTSFLDFWSLLVGSNAGEPGILNRRALYNKCNNIGRDMMGTVPGVNPCGETCLPPNGFCNLTEIIAKPTDTMKNLLNKIIAATMIGTMQSIFTDFTYLEPSWKTNCERERLLGVSITGIFDNKLLYQQENLQDRLSILRTTASLANYHWATKIGINKSAAITTVKPSGNVSQLCGTASGIHPRHSPYYVRAIKVGLTDPVCQFMIENKIPNEPCEYDNKMQIFYFPIKSPDCSVTRQKIDPISHIELCNTYSNFYTDHNVSCTISVKENEWLKVGDYVYNNFDNIQGMCFLPANELETVYRQLPYRECDKDEYNKRMEQMPSSLNWDNLSNFEHQDCTNVNREFACTGNSCEL